MSAHRRNRAEFGTIESRRPGWGDALLGRFLARRRAPGRGSVSAALLRDQRGVAAVEFGLIAIITFVMMAGAVDLSQQVIFQRDLKRFTTPELFASLRMDILERGPAAQHTDVQQVEAEVLDVANEADRQIVSVRFHGQVVEEKGDLRRTAVGTGNGMD